MSGLASSLSRARLLRSPAPFSSSAVASSSDATASSPTTPLHRANKEGRRLAEGRTGFADRFAAGVGRWSEVRRPLIGVHVRLGDGCYDSKRGGCKYVRSFDAVLVRLRQAGLTQGTIFLATDNSTIAAQAVARRVEGFEVLALQENRHAVEKSHAKGERRKEPDDLLHLQLLDLALLSQCDVIAGVFGSTFVKIALQLGRAASYVSLDTFPWCPLLRCYWGWRDMCHNCELCYNSGGGGEACNTNGYHTAGGLLHAYRMVTPVRRAFRKFIGSVKRDFGCRAFADHPLETSMYDAPVVGAVYAPRLPTPSHKGRKSRWKRRQEVCRSSDAPPLSSSCSCGFRRFPGVDNAAAAAAKPAYGYAHGVVPVPQLERAALKLGVKEGGATLASCEAACCDEPLCHSVTWRQNTSTCIAGLAIAHGARYDDWCWHPTIVHTATTSIRLPGKWRERTLEEAARFLGSPSLVRRGAAKGPRTFQKTFRTPVGHSHPMERQLSATACEPSANRGGYELSDIVAAAVPLEAHRLGCPSELHPHKVREAQGKGYFGAG
uniref:Uncharacterized protein n=1 Tax=Haptolina brevifila TaxID=156173 RepID=A0A7S2DYK5_9EUKA|mmetsp:Transcript_45809/g.91379  ORF Transcript_45809/g.91379 Transcript_45809/m.91379 type:complete len:549 (+) Transcript_45809:460-2106(+)